MFRISTPSDPSLYPLRVHDTPLQRNAQIDKGDVLATLELADGRKAQLPSPVSGTLVEPPETGRIYVEAGEIALIDPDEAAEPAPQPADETAGDWRAGLSGEQVAMVEETYRATFGRACNGAPETHPGDRATAAGIPLAWVLSLEKAAYMRAREEDPRAEDLAVTIAYQTREEARQDGFEIVRFRDRNAEGKIHYLLVPSFIAPLLASLAATRPILVGQMHALVSGMKTRPRCFEDAWDCILPDVEDLRRICAAHPPHFDTIENRTAAAFGKAELERVLMHGFSEAGRASPALWLAYGPLMEETLGQPVPETRPVDLHPFDFLAQNGKPLSAGQRDAALQRAVAAAKENGEEEGDLATQYLYAVHEKCKTPAPNESRKDAIPAASDRSPLRYFYPVMLGTTILLVALALWDPPGASRFLERIGSDISTTINALTPSSGDSRTAATMSGASVAIYQPASLDAVDNGKRPRPSEATKAAFQTWLEE